MTSREKMRWTIVAFNHPENDHSVFYRKGIKHLDRAVAKAIEAGANLMSIRGFTWIIQEQDPEIEPNQTTLTKETEL